MASGRGAASAGAESINQLPSVVTAASASKVQRHRNYVIESSAVTLRDELL